MKFKFLILWMCMLADAAAYGAANPKCHLATEELLAKAGGCWDAADYGCAKLKIQAALEEEPRCAKAVFMNSFVLERDGKTAEAEVTRRQALALDPGLSDYWEKRGHFIESQVFSEQQFAHFDLRFYGAEDRDHAWRAVKYLDEAYNDLSSRFGWEPPHRVQVIVFTTGEFMDAWRSPFIGGFFDRKDGKVRVRLDEVPGGEDEFRRVCRHEFTHAFMHQYYPKELPLWFVEGSAQFYAYANSSDAYWKENRLEELRRQCRFYPKLSLVELQQAIAEKSKVEPRVVYLAYLESEAMMAKVGKDRGESWLPLLMQHLVQGMGFENAFKDAVGVAPATELEELYHDWE